MMTPTHKLTTAYLKVVFVNFNTLRCACKAASVEIVSGRSTEDVIAAMSAGAVTPGGVQHVGAGVLVGLQAADRLGDVRPADEVALAARRQREVERQAARHLGRGPDPLGGMSDVEQPADVVVAVVAILDRPADDTTTGDRWRWSRRPSPAPVPCHPPGRRTPAGRRRGDRADVVEELCGFGATVRRPTEKANPAPVVASASKPSSSNSRAVPASQGLGITNAGSLVEVGEAVGPLAQRAAAWVCSSREVMTSTVRPSRPSGKCNDLIEPML